MKTQDAFEDQVRALDARLHPERAQQQIQRTIGREAAFVLSAVIVGFAIVVQAMFFSPVAAQVRLRFITPLSQGGGSEDNPVAASRLACGSVAVPNPCWAGSGVVGGIPTTWANCTTAACVTMCPNVTTNNTPNCAAGSVTEATIENAFSGASDNTIVWMPAGVFSTSAPRLSNSNTILRGQGANLTILKLNAVSDEGCHVGSFGQLLNVCSAGANIGVDSPDNTATWTAANYNAGQTTIALSGFANLRVGSPIWLDQNDDFAGNHTVNWAVDGYPGAGDVVIEPWGNGDVFARSGKTLMEGHVVTGCRNGSGETYGAACTTGTITIDGGLFAPFWRAAKSPGAFWASDASRVDFIGLEDFTIDGLGSQASHLTFINATSSWAKGMRIIEPTSLVPTARLAVLINCIHCEIRDSYFYGPKSSDVVNIYGLSTMISSQTLYENNIIACSINPFVSDAPSWGNVVAYNTVEGCGIGTEQGSYIQHSMEGMSLFEGNQFQNLVFDNIHAPAYFHTLLRNHLDGGTRNTIPGEEQSAHMLYAAHHFFNILGDVAGAANYSTYQNSQSPPARDDSAHFSFGWQGTSATAAESGGNDVRTMTTSLRWGNWDNATGTIRWVSSEVPTAITNYSNTVPATQTVPTSLFRSSKPSYFQSIAWPPIGPDVTGSNIVTRTGGHANKIPAKACFDATATDTTNYNSSSPPVKAFNRVTCYGA